MTFGKKIELLKQQLTGYKKVLVAFSGGVDSSLLLKIAVDTLSSENVIAATADSITYTKEELALAKKTAASLKVRHIIFKTNEFDDEEFINNSPLRCYYCKKELFKELTKIKNKYKCNAIIDGANYDDRLDHRPGSKAEEEFDIKTPLKDAGFTKADIREYSRQLSLPTHDAPSMACLASRIPYGDKITSGKIKMVNEGEKFLRSFKIKNLRLRTINDTARIEVDSADFEIVIINRTLIIDKLKKLGYKYITLDLQGFRSGSMNEVLKSGKEK